MTRFREVLRILAIHRVDFIVVGGISAVLNGAPVNTLDLDIVHSRASENIARLLRALDELADLPLSPLDIVGMVGRDMS